MGGRCRHRRCLRSCMLVPSSTTRWVGELEVLDLTGVELTEAVERVRCVGEKIQPGDWIAADCDGAIVDAVVDPVAVDLETIGQLGHGQVTGNASRVGLAALLHELMAQADTFYRAGQQMVAHRRAVAFGRRAAAIRSSGTAR